MLSKASELLKSLMCPITQEPIKEAVTTKYGHNFEKKALI